MGLHKGMTNNIAGRPKGTPNKITADLRSRISDFLNDNWERLQNDFDKIDPKDRLNFYEKLLQYGVPKLQSMELTNVLNIEKLTDKELDILIERIKNEQTAKN